MGYAPFCPNNSWDCGFFDSDEDEEKLVNEYMKEEWIQYREWKGD